MRLVLASASPRRQQLLSQLRSDFVCQPSAIEEQRMAAESASEYVQRLALEKALAVATQQLQHTVVLGSDTLIDANGEVLEKPRDKAHFMAMLARLSDGCHQVRTAVSAVVVAEHEVQASQIIEVVTDIEFGQISRADLENYWATGEPQDKAGGYAIQGGAARFVKRINGSYTGVVGLPLYQTEQLLLQAEAQLRSLNER